jgi:Kazal-type serine protease inhibitor domain
MQRLVSFLVLTVGLAVCAQGAAASQGRPIILAQGAPQVCTDVYQPVCGTNPSGMRVTYSNACFARAAMATNVTPGECPK